VIDRREGRKSVSMLTGKRPNGHVTGPRSATPPDPRRLSNGIQLEAPAISRGFSRGTRVAVLY
jgi:hypothetical protein